MSVASVVPGRFGDLLRELRLTAGLTQQELADLSALSVRALRDLEAGRVQQPRRDTVRLLAAALRLEGERGIAFDAAWRATRSGATPPVPAARADAENRRLGLPPPARPFGREREMESLVEQLSSRQAGLLTVIGLPGVGKTHLVSAALEQLHAECARPVLRLEPSAMGLGAAARRLDTREGEPEPLLVLDDPGGGADLLGRNAGLRAGLAELTLRHPRCGVVVTSRAPTGLPGEQLMALAPLPAPRPGGAGFDPAGAVGRASMDLFLARARRALPHFRPSAAETASLAELCYQLDGLPLALERAAEWSLLHSPGELAAWAREDPLGMVGRPLAEERGRCLATALGEVLAALSPGCRALLRMLAERDQAWTVPALMREIGGSRDDLLRELHALVLRGLVQAWPPREPRAFRVPRIVARLLRGRPEQEAAGTSGRLPVQLPGRAAHGA